MPTPLHIPWPCSCFSPKLSHENGELPSTATDILWARMKQHLKRGWGNKSSQQRRGDIYNGPLSLRWRGRHGFWDLRFGDLAWLRKASILFPVNEYDVIKLEGDFSNEKPGSRISFHGGYNKNSIASWVVSFIKSSILVLGKCPGLTMFHLYGSSLTLWSHACLSSNFNLHFFIFTFQLLIPILVCMAQLEEFFSTQ